MKKSTSSILPLWFATMTILVGVACEAAVAWSGSQAELRAAHGQDQTVAALSFRISDELPLSLTSLRPSGDCVDPNEILHRRVALPPSALTATRGRLQLDATINQQTRISPARLVVE